MKKCTHKAFVQRIHTMGAKVELYDDYNVEAPRGFTWDGDVHCVVVGYNPEDRAEFFTRFDVPRKCENPDCEYCNTNPENNDPRYAIRDIQL